MDTDANENANAEREVDARADMAKREKEQREIAAASATVMQFDEKQVEDFKAAFALFDADGKRTRFRKMN